MKSLKYIIFFVLVSLLSHFSTAQPFNIHVNNSPEILGWSNGCVQTSDSGFVIATQDWPDSYLSLAKYDANFKNLLWKKTIFNKPACYMEVCELRQTIDNGFMMYGLTSQIDAADLYFLKFNSCGEKEWAYIYHDTNDQGAGNRPTNMIPLDNGSYMAFSANHLLRYDISQSSTVFIFDSAMNQIDNYSFWWTNFGRLKKYTNVINSAGHMYVADIDPQYTPIDTTALTTRLAPMSFGSTGNLLWYSPLVGIENKMTGVIDIVKSTDGFVYSYGIEYIDDGAIRIMAKHDTLGNFINMVRFGYAWHVPHWITIRSMVETDDDGFIVTSYENKTAASKKLSRIEKVTKQGTVTDSLIFGDGIEHYDPLNVQRTLDGKYIVLMNVGNNGNYISHTYVVKLDQNLRIVNMDTITQHTYDNLCGHTPTSDTIYLDSSFVKIRELKADSGMVYRYVFKKNGIANEITPKRTWLNTYPNPATDVLHINLLEFSNLADLALEVYDMQGKKISSFVIPKGKEIFTVNLDNYAKGSYALQIKSAGKLLAGNVVVVQ